MTHLAQAAERFRQSQEALAAFIQEHMTFGPDGLEFISERNQKTLARQLDALRAEHKAAGAAWAAELPITVPQ